MTVVATTPREQERFFAEFFRYERLTGGPDPHMTLALHLGQSDSWIERAWRVGCYLAAYNVPTGLMLWTDWSYERVREEPEALEPWIREHWEGLSWRRERRAVRTRTKLAQHLVSYAAWVNRLPNEPWVGTGDYDAAWRSADGIYGTGRYIKLKTLEALNRTCNIGVSLNDLRARGGSSPREALALLYPQYRTALKGDDRQEHLDIADMCGAWARETLAERHGLECSWYELQASSCEWKQSVIGGSQYPGRAMDSELGHYHKIVNHWGKEALQPILDGRRELFPGWSLGEQQGWDGRRAELGRVLIDYGYTWTDSTLDYIATLHAGGDFSRPVERKVLLKRPRTTTTEGTT